VFAVFASLAMVPGKETFLGNMYAFGAMLSFTTAHVSLIGLRWRLAKNRMRKLPGDVEVTNGEEDWYRAPFNVTVGGVHVPLFAVFGGLLTATAWVTVMALHLDILIAGMAWLLFGMTTYVLYGRSKGLSLTETRMVELPPLSGAKPVSYTAVLVAFEEDTYSETAMATALKLAAHRHGDVRVLVTLEVPQHLSIDAPLPEAEARASAVIETARQWAGRGQRVRGQILRVRPREAGHRIVEVARNSRADAIVMPMPERRPSNGRLLSPTLETVLRKRPARVIVDSTPARPLQPAGAGNGARSPQAGRVPLRNEDPLVHKEHVAARRGDAVRAAVEDHDLPDLGERTVAVPRPAALRSRKRTVRGRDAAIASNRRVGGAHAVQIDGLRDVDDGRRVGAAARVDRVVVVGDPDRGVGQQLAGVVWAPRRVRTAAGRGSCRLATDVRDRSREDHVVEGRGPDLELHEPL
jgi:nucleotide-binding universal stress UspA family protein